MRVQDLGALAVVIGGQQQPIAGTKAAALLAVLAINANHRVSVDTLMGAAWGEQITVGAASTLTSHIWRLRRLLEPARDRRQPPSVLVNDSDGYRLVCSPATLDSLLFSEAANEVRQLLLAGQAEAAVRRAESALGLWRGTPYGAFGEADWGLAAVARLEELRGQLQERRIEALLASGAADAALSDLPPLIAAMPFRQSLRALQMQALYRVGRGEQALQAYQQARSILVDEVGIEPGHELQQLHQQILRNDPTLAPPQPPPAPSQQQVEVHLPPALTPIIGRDDVLGRLTELIPSRRLVTVIGAAGCGKTRVAVEAARAVASEFPDGVWFVDLTPVSHAELVPELTVSTIGLAGSAGATPLQDLRLYLQTRRMLLVLDNCEHVLDGVDEIIRTTLGDPGVSAECCFLITSREPIGVDGETIWQLSPLGLPDGGTDGNMTDIHLRAPAVELFVQRLATAVPTLTVDRQVLARAAEIAVAVDGLPLPIELAAARALSHSLDDIAAQVTADPTRLSRVGRGPRDHRATLGSAIEWSHHLLSPEEQIAHRRLSVLPGAFTSDVAAAVISGPSDDEPADADALLARLVHRSMLASEGALGDDHDRPTTFHQLATVRSHARHALAASEETRSRLDRRDGWTAALMAVRPPLGTVAEVDWYARIDDDYDTVRATLTRRLIDQPCAEGGIMAYHLTYYWFNRERLVEAARWLQLGYDVLHDQDPTDALLARIWLAAVHAVQRRLDLARPHIVDLEAAVHSTPPERLIEVGEGLVALAMWMYISDEPALLRWLHELLTWVDVAAADPNLGLLTDAVGCCTLLVAGRLEEATALALAVQARAERAQNLMADYVSTAPLIVGALKDVRPEDGLPWIDRCLTTHLKLGTGSLGMFIETRANFVAQLGDYVQAARSYSASRTVTRRAGTVWPTRAWTPPLLEQTRQRLSRAEFERAWRDGERLTVAELVAATSERALVAGSGAGDREVRALPQR